MQAIAAEMAGSSASGKASGIGGVRVYAPARYTGASELFFMTLRALHLGPVSSISRLERIDREISQAKK